MKKRLFALILAMLLAAPAAVSCSENASGDTETETAASAGETAADPSAETEAETEERLKPDIPEKADFGGDNIHYLTWNISSWGGGAHESRDLVAEEINGEAINDAVYNRNLFVSENYNVTFSLEIRESGEIVGMVNNCVQAGDSTYDVVFPRLYEAPALFRNGSLVNLHEVPNIDLSKPWWDSNAAESLTCYGYLPAIAASINVNDKDATAGLAFNKTVAENYNIEDVYTLVREGRWTLDKLCELADVVDGDLNGNGTLDDGDMYGFIGMQDAMESFYYGSGFRHATIAEDGGVVFTYGSEPELNHTQNIIEMMAQDWFWNNHIDISPRTMAERFTNGEGLFMWIRLSDVTNMRGLDGDFGVIPTPKANEEQDGYYSMVSRHSTGILSIPITVYGEQLEQLGMVLEALAAESHYTVIPAYIETSLKTKHSRDAESGEMIDIIISNRVYDPVYIYNLANFADQFISLGNSGQANIVSFLKPREKLISKSVEGHNQTFIEIAEQQESIG